MWTAIGLGAHTLWGIYPVLARYLQTVSRLPTLSLITFGNSVVLLLLLATTLRRVDRRVFLQPILWLFAGVVVCRAISNLFAARFTLAIYVQLITLMTPFLVTLLSATILRDEIPPYTGRALVLSLIGAAMMIGGGLWSSGSQRPLTVWDAIGLALALGSSFFLALYMVLVRRTTRHAIPGEAVLGTQIVALVLVSGLLSLAFGEDWGRYLEISARDWAVFGLFTFGVLLGANIMQISALRHLSAPLMGSLLPWRLVSALVFGMVLLGEKLTSPLQVAGAIIVLVTITWYLRRQAKAPMSSSA
ncbi:MAG: EamA family transporter [Anaerolineae bacterium]